MGRDPIARILSDVNAYNYVDAQASGKVDPSGLCPESCCCCVDDLSLLTPRLFEDGTNFGHKLDFVVSSHSKVSESRSPCDFEWWEYTDQAYTFLPAFEWHDLYHEWGSARIPLFVPWDESMGSLCRFPNRGRSVKLSDPPAAWKNVEGYVRNLWINVIVKSALECPCEAAMKSVCILQHLEVDGNGFPAFEKSKVFSAPTDPATGRCMSTSLDQAGLKELPVKPVK